MQCKCGGAMAYKERADGAYWHCQQKRGESVSGCGRVQVVKSGAEKSPMIPDYVGNSDTMIIHSTVSDCVLNMHPRNYVGIDDLDIAKSDGFRECQLCLVVRRPQYSTFKIIKEAVRDTKYSECLVCGETRGVQRAHIIPRRHGGVDCMPLCPNHHWNYDHGLLTQDEQKLVFDWIGMKYNVGYAYWIKRQYEKQTA